MENEEDASSACEEVVLQDVGLQPAEARRLARDERDLQRPDVLRESSPLHGRGDAAGAQV